MKELDGRGISYVRERPFRGGRRHGIGTFFVDLAFEGEKLAVEIDGPEHRYKVDDDAARDSTLAAFGWQVLRFSNAEVLRSTPEVADQIIAALIARQAVRIQPSSLPTDLAARFILA